VAKRYYLSFERTPRPEEVQENPPEQIEKLEHPAFIARFGRSDQSFSHSMTTNIELPLPNI
jgi:hypothetical protein